MVYRTIIVFLLTLSIHICNAQVPLPAPTAYLLVNTGDCINCYLQVHQLTERLLATRPITLVFPSSQQRYAQRFITDQLNLPTTTHFVASDSLIRLFTDGKPLLETGVAVRQGQQTLYYSALKLADLATVQRLLPAAAPTLSQLTPPFSVAATSAVVPRVPAAWLNSRWTPFRLDSLQPRLSTRLDLALTSSYFLLTDYNYGTVHTLSRRTGELQTYSAASLPATEAYRLYFGDTSDYHARRTLIRLMETKMHKAAVRAEGIALAGDTINVLYSLAYPQQKNQAIGISTKFLLVQYLNGHQRAGWPMPEKLNGRYYPDHTSPFRLCGRRLWLAVSSEKLYHRNPVYAQITLSSPKEAGRLLSFDPYVLPPFFCQHGLVYEYNLGYLEDELFHFHYANEFYDLSTGRTYQFDYRPVYEHHGQDFTASIYTLSLLRLPAGRVRVLTQRQDSFFVSTGTPGNDLVLRTTSPQRLRITPGAIFSQPCLAPDGYVYYVDDQLRLQREAVD